MYGELLRLIMAQQDSIGEAFITSVKEGLAVYSKVR